MCTYRCRSTNKGQSAALLVVTCGQPGSEQWRFVPAASPPAHAGGRHEKQRRPPGHVTLTLASASTEVRGLSHDGRPSAQAFQDCSELHPTKTKKGELRSSLIILCNIKKV